MDRRQAMRVEVLVGRAMCMAEVSWARRLSNDFF